MKLIGWKEIKQALIAVVFAALVAANFSACNVFKPSTWPAWVTTIENAAKVMVPIAASVIGSIKPELKPAAQLVSNAVTALINAIQTYKTKPTETAKQQVVAAAETIYERIDELAAAARVLNPDNLATIERICDLMRQVVVEIVNLVPDTQSKLATVKGAGAPLTSDQIKAEYNRIVDGTEFKPVE